MIEIELPDGSIGEFPDGTPDDVISSALRKTFPKQEERPSGPTQAIHGLNEAFYSPVVGAEKLIADNLFGSEKRPVADFLKKHQYPSDPVTSGDRIWRSAGAMVPETAATAAALALAAPATLPGMVSRAVPGVGEMLRNSILYPYKNAAPAMTGVADVAGALGAGAGSQAYKELSDGPTGIGEFNSGIAGGAVAGALPASAAAYSKWGPLGLVARLGRNVISENLPENLIDKIPGMRGIVDSRREVVREKQLPKIAKELQGLNQPEMQEGMGVAAALRQEIDGFNPSLAESTGLPSAVAAQTTIERNATGADLDALARRRALNEQALHRYEGQGAPQADNAERTVSESMQRRVDAARESREGQTRKLAEQALDLPGQLPRADTEAQGSKLRDRMMELRGGVSKEMNALAEESGLDATTWLPFGKLQARIKAMKPSKFAEGDDLGATLKTIEDYQHKAGEPVNFQDVKFLREKLGDEIRTAEKAGERSKARILRQGRDEIDAFLDDDVPAKVFQGDIGLQGKYKEFRKRYKEEFIDRFETGSGREAKRVGPDQRYRTADEDVASEFFEAGNVRAARDFQTVFQGDAEAADAMKATILDSARAASVKDGAVDRRALERWYKSHQSVLDQFPEARDLVKDVGRAAENIEGRRATLVLRGRQIEDTRFAKAAGGEPEKAVDALLSDKRMADRAIRAMDEGEKNAFSRAMWDYAIGKENDPSPETIKAFLKEHGDITRKVMTPEHLKALGNLAQGWEMLGRVQSPVGKMANADPLKGVQEAIGSGPLQISSRVFAASSGRTSWRMVLTDLLARAGVATSQKEAQNVARQALYDANFANELAAYVRDPNSRLGKESVPKMKAYVSAMGIRAATPDEQDKER